jgi:hypothetical protein
MAGVKGKSGPKQEKPWKEALNISVSDIDPVTKFKKLRCIAEKTVELAMAGDMAAIKEIGDRLDGKAPQDIGLNVSESFVEAMREINRLRGIVQEEPKSIQVTH